MANPNVHRYFYLFMSGTGKTVVFTATIPDAGYLIPDIPKFPTSEIRKHPVFSLPGRSSESAKAGNRYPGSRNIVSRMLQLQVDSAPTVVDTRTKIFNPYKCPTALPNSIPAIMYSVLPGHVSFVGVGSCLLRYGRPPGQSARPCLPGIQSNFHLNAQLTLFSLYGGSR
jgi:hypothetical protein